MRIGKARPLYAQPSGLPILLLLLAALLLLMTAAGCGNDPTEVLLGNQPPVVALDPEPIRDAQNGAVATFSWTASDPDGEVVLFRYAIDDTVGAGAWIETEETEITLAFTAPDSARVDSIFASGTEPPILRYVFNGMHTFFLRAVDDDGAVSPPAYVSFNAESIAPQTEILTPASTGFVLVGTRLGVSWIGRDPDDLGDPAGYSWRLVQVDNVLALTDEAIERMLFDPASAGAPWSDFAADTSVELELPATPGHYLFGVRALDQAGAVEPRLRTFRSPAPANVILVRSTETGARPRLRVSTASKSTLYPVVDPRRRIFHIPANTGVLLIWQGEVDHYGGHVADYAYGVDLEHTQDDNPDWSPASPTLTEVRLNFAVAPGAVERHQLFVRLRDTYGNRLVAELDLVVQPFTFERDVLYVDDWGPDAKGLDYPELGPSCTPQAAGGELPDGAINPGADQPPDSCHDSFFQAALREALTDLGHADWTVDRMEVLDPVRGLALTDAARIDSLGQEHWVLTGAISAAVLARYKLVVWNTKSQPGNALAGISGGVEQNLLATYVGAGGALWLTGTGVFSRTTASGGGVGLSVFGYGPNDFPYQVLKIHSRFDGSGCTQGCFRQTGETAVFGRRNGFEGAYTSALAAREGFPDLRLARAPFAGNPVKGITGCDAMVPPFGLEIDAELEPIGGRLDTLYFFQSNGLLEVFPPAPSWMDDGAVALRYTDPDQGRLMMFGFPLFYLADADGSAVMRNGLRWLLGE